MEALTINRATLDLASQLEFLIRQEFLITYYKYRRLAYYLVAITIFLIGLVFLSDKDSLITLKAIAIVFIALFWLVALVFLATILIKRHNRNVWKTNAIKDVTLNDTKFQFAFDYERLYFYTDKFNTDIKWDFYKYYAFYKGSIFIIPERNIYESLYYSREELGVEHFDLLKEIVMQKLDPINQQNGA